ncbi:MAG TPA: nickel-dependent hydrogenase large subunit [Gemmatimonadaceae bacterium]|nr:nickel-dependent hydrogenase large subunit [Gemmatimonadaceae bacterium]
MATTKVVVDPITRIEGHLRIEAQADNGRISNAWASATQFRGIELVLQGRDPRDAWAFAQRICGVCTVVHAVASLRAVEDALDIKIPPNANLIRNLTVGMQFVHDHVMHFYHLHALDWVDIVSALKADPVKAAAIGQSLSSYPLNSVPHFREVQEKLKKFVGSGQLGIFANGYWGHPAYVLPPEVNLLAAVHYLDALDWQRDVVRLHTIFGGKNPHPNFLVGGMASAISLSDLTTINSAKLAQIHGLIQTAQDFVEQVYWPDLVAIAGFYKDWAKIGGGTKNYLACGEFPEGDIKDTSSLYFPRGIIKNNDLSKVEPYDHQGVAEYINSSWYTYSGGDDKGLHPYQGESTPKYTGPPTPWKYLQDEKKYSWMKAPRYNGMAMQVGPLPRMLVAFASGHKDVVPLVADTLKKLGVGPEALFSTLGRTAARGIETVVIARRLSTWYDALVKRISDGDTRTFDESKWEPSTWPKSAKGYGYLDAPRGALGHWVEIDNGQIARYQCVVPSTWNCSPRDGQGQLGPYEAALTDNHPLKNPEQPLEILRTIHSFDPCLACGVHVIDATGRLITKVTVR